MLRSLKLQRFKKKKKKSTFPAPALKVFGPMREIDGSTQWKETCSGYYMNTKKSYLIHNELGGGDGYSRFIGTYMILGLNLEHE